MKKQIIAGIDVGGTSVKMGFFTTDYELMEKWSTETKKSFTADELVEEIAESVKNKLKEKTYDNCELISAGMGVPGSVSDGLVTYAPNIRWENFDAAGHLGKLLNIPVAIQNDANTAAYGELKCGSAKGKTSICFVTLGTGVGGGMVTNNHIINGFCGCGGEIGHITVNKNETKKCGCGRCGCLEQYVSATGIANMAHEFMNKDTDRTSVLYNYDKITAKEVFDAAKAKDKLSLEIADKFGQILGLALSNIACVFNPQIIVIGGGVSAAGNIIIDYVQKYFMKNAYSACKNTEFAIASLGNDAGIYGAACIPQNKF